MIGKLALVALTVLSSLNLEPGVSAAPGRNAGAADAPRARAVNRADVREAEQVLDELGYWLASADGVWDVSSRHALTAFQKVEGMEATGRLTPEVLDRLRTAQRPRPLEGGPAHVEVDIASQVLLFVEDGGRVSRILPVSTGNDERMRIAGVSAWAYTPRGRFAVRNKISGWRKSELGLLYYPSYVVGGIAIHGNPQVPAYPDSHGCIRVPMFAAKALSEMLEVGTPVIVHDGGSLANVPAHIRKQADKAIASAR